MATFALLPFEWSWYMCPRESDRLQRNLLFTWGWVGHFCSFINLGERPLAVTVEPSAFRFFPRTDSTTGLVDESRVGRMPCHACRCFGSDRAPRVAPRGAFWSRTVLPTVAQWFMPDARETVDNFVQVRAALRRVIPYVLAWILYVVGYKGGFSRMLEN
jgi:hypothetical protein